VPALTLLGRFAVAQPRVVYVGYLTPSLPAEEGLLHTEAVAEGLRDQGHVEGLTLVFERRVAERSEHFGPLAADLVRLKVELIVAVTNAAAAAASEATQAIPVVFVGVSDPDRSGRASDHARPGGNVTGVVESSATRVGALVNTQQVPESTFWPSMQAAARLAGLDIQQVNVASGGALESGLANLPARGMNALLVGANELNLVYGWQIAQTALKQRLPSIWPWRTGPDAGGLSYAADRRAIYARAGDLAGRILKGAAPSTLPVQQPPKFELVINARTAKALGLTMPHPLLIQVDHVVL
jgi:putative tryptophan/tyrosine transport system substrate-binding protein